MTDTSKATPRIVKAVNAYTAMREALSATLDQLEAWGCDEGPLANDVRAALAAAEGEGE